MQTLLKKYLSQLTLDLYLHKSPDWEGSASLENLEFLLKEGADPNYLVRFGDSLISYVALYWPEEQREAGIDLLLQYGAGINLPRNEERTILYECLSEKYPEAMIALVRGKGVIPLKSLDFDNPKADFTCRIGRKNPDRFDNPYYHFMVASGLAAFHVGKISGAPRWCNKRFGTTHTILEDGTLVQIGGEHEDFYDEDFHIYNDVIRITPTGEVDIFGYPEHIFPATDFHSATLLEDSILIIGGLDYKQARKAGLTRMYRLSLDDYSIKKVSHTGENPGWIYEHLTLYDPQQNCLYVFGGIIFDGKEYVDNRSLYTFDLSTKNWTNLGEGNPLCAEILKLKAGESNGT